MRCLHVVDSLAPTPHACALLALLKLQRAGPAAGDDTHDVLAFADGELESPLTRVARRLFIAGRGLDIAAVVHARAYDVVHALDRRAAHHVAPLVVGVSTGAFVYSGRALAGKRATIEHDPDGASDASLLAATDLAILDPLDESLDPLLDVGGHLARLDLARIAAFASVDGDIAASGRVSEFVLREWLALLTRPRIRARTAA